MRIERCREMAGSEMLKGSARALTDEGPPASFSRIALRVGSASAEKTELRSGSSRLTIWLNIMRREEKVKEESGTPLPSHVKTAGPRGGAESASVDCDARPPGIACLRKSCYHEMMGSKNIPAGSKSVQPEDKI